MNGKIALPCTIVALLGVTILSMPLFAPPPRGNGGMNDSGNGGDDDNGKGRLSPASLDIDTCGCPTTFGDPVCEERTSWTLEKSTESGPFENPVGAVYSFTVTVTEGPTTQHLTGSGTLIVTNSGEQTVFLESVAVLLESNHDGGGPCAGPAGGPGPSGNNWRVEAAATQARNCADDLAVTCYGNFQTSAGASLVLIDPDTNDPIALSDVLAVAPSLDDDNDGVRDEDPPNTGINDTANACAIMDNDGDGLIDEDPIDGIDNDNDGLIDEDDPDDDGDGLVDEDGPCDDNALILNFVYDFDITNVTSCDGDVIGQSDGIPGTGDEWRIDLLVTFIAGGRRGGTCTKDADCDGTDETDVRTVQQRLEFELDSCTQVCDCVELTDAGASANDPSCVFVTSNTLDEQICSEGEGTVTNRTITGTVTCIGENCTTDVTNIATLTCEDPELIEGSPAGASFTVTCGDGPPPDGDFCSQTQGGWGQGPQGNNPGACLHASFGTLFPSGLVIGDADGPDADACWAILLTDAQAVTDFLPTGGTPAILTADLTDPLVSSAGVFAGQLVAATINVAFSASAQTCPGRDFPAGLGTLTYNAGCVDDDLVGLSVNQVIAIANSVISGCASPPAGVTISDISDALATLNENFVDCDTDQGCLSLPLLPSASR